MTVKNRVGVQLLYTEISEKATPRRKYLSPKLTDEKEPTTRRAG